MMPLTILAMLAAAAPAALPPKERPADIIVEGRLRPIDAPIVPDRALAQMRGGIRISNGFDIAIGVDIQTRVDGLLVLHTVYASDGPTAGVRVYTDGLSGPRTAPATVMVTVPGSTGQTAVTVDRSPTGTTITMGGASAPASINLLEAEPGLWLNANSQTPVPVTADGTPVTQGPGTFALTTDDDGSVVTLDTQMLQIRHLVGQATGAVIANTASDRTIDTISSINVDLQGISPPLLASLFTADALAFDAMSRR